MRGRLGDPESAKENRPFNEFKLDRPLVVPFLLPLSPAIIIPTYFVIMHSGHVQFTACLDPYSAVCGIEQEMGRGKERRFWIASGHYVVRIHKKKCV